jgi:beta-phosphoglucomutase-like phosphatase (HAD superfamily)/dTDP-glucose pyrophosphorylase
MKENKIKLLVFDLDGVLLEGKTIHFTTLNKSLSQIDSKFVISWDEHLSCFDGLKTNEKLFKLTKNRGLDISLHKKIWDEKQKLTLDELHDLTPSIDLQNCFSKLVKDGYKIACGSNSIRKTVLTVLSKLGIIEYFDLIISNEDVKNSKPHPEIYWTTISNIGVLPEETLIIEDSPYGLLAASRSKANVLRVTNPSEVTYQRIIDNINEIENNRNMKTPKWVDSKLNILIPMAGAGSRFEQSGYTFPKPLIDVNGDPMIKLVSDNLNMEANFIYIVQKSHNKKYNLKTLLNLISPNCTIVEVDGITEGAAVTTLLAKEFINNNQPLIMANSDQFLEWDSNEFMYKMNETNCDGGIVTFTATHPKWSFAKVNDYGLVTEVAEKNPISDIATVGVYFWKKGSDYVKYAEQMIEKNIRTNNEFYVCPVFNEAIQDGKEIRPFNIKKMWGIGVPEDLNYFLEHYK